MLPVGLLKPRKSGPLFQQLLVRGTDLRWLGIGRHLSLDLLGPQGKGRTARLALFGFDLFTFFTTLVQLFSTARVLHGERFWNFLRNVFNDLVTFDLVFRMVSVGNYVNLQMLLK
uniref:(northern house mosquito) hypothetical protein n=1 Tax=Culex pipiens TaxID=7175 RepID=A0A8D8MTI1_CULPI